MENCVDKKREEIKDERIEKYIRKIDEHHKARNQIYIKDNQVKLVTNGNLVSDRWEIKGYIKFPNDEYIRPINEVDLMISLLPKKKMIVTVEKNRHYFRGYKKGGNDDGLLIMLFIKGMFNDCLLIDLGKTDSPYLCIRGDGEEGYDDDELTFNICESLLLDNAAIRLQTIDMKEANTTDEEDEWE